MQAAADHVEQQDGRLLTRCTALQYALLVESERRTQADQKHRPKLSPRGLANVRSDLAPRPERESNLVIGFIPSDEAFGHGLGRRQRDREREREGASRRGIVSLCA